jgi:hypothetical protein
LISLETDDELIENAEEDGNGGDCGSEVEDEVEEEEDLETTTNSAAAWLGDPPKGQNKLREGKIYCTRYCCLMPHC